MNWLDFLRADAVFGWRQINKRRATSAAAILSLALAIGACTSAFRIVDALFLRPLPITAPERLYVIQDQNHGDGWSYTRFRQMRSAVQNQAELIAISRAASIDVAYTSGQDMEKASLQHVSGWMFGSFGLRPALGRLFTESDDLKPGAHPVAVLSYDYWTRRFARDPNVIGRAVRAGPDWRIGESAKSFEIVGVAPERFIGTEPGIVTDIFVPAMMHSLVEVSYAGVFRAFVRLPPHASIEPVRDRLFAALQATEGAKAPSALIAEPAAAGVSAMQRDYREALAALAILVALVLLIACLNVANLMTAQAAARSREMALRIAIGAGRPRLVQLVLVESAMLAFLAAAVGVLFAIWSGPFVVDRINPPDNPARLPLPVDWRVLTFGLALTFFVIVLFGLAPALRASRTQPFGELKSRGSRSLMNASIAAQAAFSVLVLFVAGLFVATFDRLSHQPTGISADRLLNLNVIAQRPTEPAVLWDQSRRAPPQNPRR